jgi:hypothetical protein
MRTWKSLLAVSLLAGGAAACGDDEGGSSPDANLIDAVDIDAGIDAGPSATRSATIAVADVELTSADAVARGIRGSSISIEFSDLTEGGGEVVFGTSPIGGCLVQRFDADGTPNSPNPTLGAGEVTITGPEVGTSGLLKTVGPCNYQAGAGYLCISGGAQDDDVTATGVGSGAVAYSFPNQSFAGQDLVGSYLNVTGFTGDDVVYNSPAGQPFAIMAQPAPTTLVVVNQAGTASPASTTGVDVVDFAVLNGAGPTPQPQAPFDNDFLGDETTSVRVQKAADAEWGAIDFTTYTRGEGFTLDDASALPHEFPATAADMAFSCAGTGGDCGAEGTATLEAIIISGKTTDTPVGTLPFDFLMPPPTTEYATFQCGFLLADSGTIPEAAVQAILDTNPTRVEVRVLRVAGTIVTDGLNEGRILIGHGVVGHTDIP